MTAYARGAGFTYDVAAAPPTEGLQVGLLHSDTTSGTLKRWDGAAWVDVGGAAHASTHGTGGSDELPAGAIDDTMLQSINGFSVMGRPVTGVGNRSAIDVPTNTVVGRKAGNVVAETIATAQIGDNAVTLAKLADIATASVLGRTTAATGDPEVLTAAQTTALLDPFTSTLKGLVPASGGGTTNFLRADGAFAAPPAGGSPPTGTGFRHVTAGTEDAAAKLVDTADVNDDQITYAKLQNVTDARLLGRSAGSAGDAQEITVGSGLSLSAGALTATGGSLSYQEADRTTDLALTTTYAAATSLSLGAGTWLVMGQSSIESTSTTQGNVSIRLRDTTNSVTHSIAEGEVDSALPDRLALTVHAVIVLATTATVALEGRQSAGTSHMIGPGNLADTATKVTRLTAVKIA